MRGSGVSTFFLAPTRLVVILTLSLRSGRIHGKLDAASLPVIFFLHTLSGHKRRTSPILGQVLPLRIQRLNQCNLFGASPAFDRFLPGNCRADISVFFKIREPVTMVLRCETRLDTSLVFKNPLRKLAGYPGIKGSSPSDQNVNPALRHSCFQTS